MSEKTSIVMIQSFFHSNLDYCNKIFHNFMKIFYHKIKKILQNNAARIIKQKTKFNHITLELRDLHLTSCGIMTDF